MKSKNLATGALVTIVGVGIWLGASSLVKQARVRQLLETRECSDCNLSYVNLGNADLEGVNLENANLQGANLEGTDLKNANLEGANLKNANLERTQLGSANLEGANLERTNLDAANLGCAAISFDLRATEQEASMNLNVDANPKPADPEDNNLGFNFKLNEQGASMRFNLLGCPNLKGAKMPNGKIHS